MKKEIEEIIERCKDIYETTSKEYWEVQEKLKTASTKEEKKELYKEEKILQEKMLYNTASMLAYQHVLDMMK